MLGVCIAAFAAARVARLGQISPAQSGNPNKSKNSTYYDQRTESITNYQQSPSLAAVGRGKSSQIWQPCLRGAHRAPRRLPALRARDLTPITRTSSAPAKHIRKANDSFLFFLLPLVSRRSAVPTGSAWWLWCWWRRWPPRGPHGVTASGAGSPPAVPEPSIASSSSSFRVTRAL